MHILHAQSHRRRLLFRGCPGGIRAASRASRSLRVGGAVNEAGHVAIFMIVETRHFQHQFGMRSPTRDAWRGPDRNSRPAADRAPRSADRAGWPGRVRPDAPVMGVKSFRPAAGKCAQQRIAEGKNDMRVIAMRPALRRAQPGSRSLAAAMRHSDIPAPDKTGCLRRKYRIVALCHVLFHLVGLLYKTIL